MRTWLSVPPALPCSSGFAALLGSTTTRPRRRCAGFAPADRGLALSTATRFGFRCIALRQSAAARFSFGLWSARARGRPGSASHRSWMVSALAASGVVLRSYPLLVPARRRKNALDDRSPVREHFAWTYGTLAMVHAALKDGATDYGPLHYVIRGRFRNGYLAGTIRMRPLYDDERSKMRHAATCCYCGRSGALSLDHLIPRFNGGPDAADNIVYACRSCNSSKGSKDMVLWLVSKGRFPAVLVLRRYLKLAARYCEDAGLIDSAWADLVDDELPFDKRSLRVEWPPLAAQAIWPAPDSAP